MKKVDINKIIDTEWRQFQKVQNEGGRAPCQDDFGTFQIMRESQFITWPEPMLKSYLSDLEMAQERGWNLIFEKYARMMESTAPEQFAEIASILPDTEKNKAEKMEEVIAIQVKWMDEFAMVYQKLMNNARCIHTWEDSMYETSSETYLRGELYTYSDETFRLYYKFITSLNLSEQNLTQMINKHMVESYGYASLEAAEAAQ